jgi:hypothetical protein
LKILIIQAGLLTHRDSLVIESTTQGAPGYASSLF